MCDCAFASYTDTLGMSEGKGGRREGKGRKERREKRERGKEREMEK